MRLKKQKRHRRSVRFYTTCFGFRDPFKVLCDGTFIHHVRGNVSTPADTALSNILGAAVKMFATRCVLAELRSLGDSFSDSLAAASKLIPARCDHDKRKSAAACLAEVIGENNPEHFFVATQDVELRRKLHELPAVPVIFALRNALLLEPPSESQRQFAKTAEEERSHMTELEMKMLHLKKKKRITSDEPGDSSDVHEGPDEQISVSQAKVNSARNIDDMKNKAQFKRKKAKGPNPLSCKKKQNGKSKQVPEKSKQDNENGEAVRSRSRKRKRPRKQKNITHSTG